MDIAAYIAEIRTLYASGQTTEHSFRPALERLFKSIDPTLTVINEPRRIVDVGAVDFVFQRAMSQSDGARPRTLARTSANSRRTITARPRKTATARRSPA